MADIPVHNPDIRSLIFADDEEYTDEQVIQVLASYGTEAEEARMGGTNPRDTIWEANWDRYWGRYDHSKKAAWQSKHVMPEAPQFVDRWAAAMREALDSGGDWFDVDDEGGKLKPLVKVIKKAMRAILGKCARTPDGHTADFSSVFEDEMKLGALMACCAAVTWQPDKNGGWVRVDAVDPRETHYDPKGRGLYRRRRYIIDKYELMAKARQSDDNGEALYDTEQIMALMASAGDETYRLDKERASGSSRGQGASPSRNEVLIDEWLCTVIMPDGNVAATNSLIVIANEQYMIRGPEKNPFWHDRDWLVFTPMVTVPLSIYGRSYMEDWADVSDAFIEMTNLILDGAFTSTVRAFIANPQLLEDPSQIAEGISPNKVFTTEEDLQDLRRVITTLDLGTLPNEAVVVWKSLKEELREGAKLSEIALGQMAPHSRTTKAEIEHVSRSGSAMIRSMARTIESRFVEPVLNLVWQTALQHMDFTTLEGAIGPAAARMLNTKRKEFSDASITFRVRGISGIVDRQQRLQNMLSALSVITENQMLAQTFMQQMDPQKLLQTLLTLFGVDMQDLNLTQEEAAMQQLVNAATQYGQQGAQPGAAAGAPAANNDAMDLIQ